MCRVAGVTDLCDHPKEAASRHKVVRCSADCTSADGPSQRDPRNGGPGWTVDAEMLAREGPGLVLASDCGAACATDAHTVAEVGGLRINPGSLSDWHAALYQQGMGLPMPSLWGDIHALGMIDLGLLNHAPGFIRVSFLFFDFSVSRGVSAVGAS